MTKTETDWSNNMRKIVLSFMLLLAMLLCSCTDDSTTADTTTATAETYSTTTIVAFSTVTTATEGISSKASELYSWITKEYAKDIERITKEAEESYIIYSDNYEGVGLLPLRVYLSITDISADGIPEVFTGFGNDREHILYSAYSYNNLKYIDICFLSSELGNIFDNKKYIGNDGKEYYYAVIFTGNATQKRYQVTKIWYENNRWYSEETDVSNEDLILPKKYEPLITATVQINPDDIKGSVEQCFIEYYSQLYDYDGNRLAQ